MRYLPIELDLAGRDALVVGVSPESLAKVQRLLSAGARVTLLGCDDDDPHVVALRAGGADTASLAALPRALEDRDLARAAIVFVTPEDPAIGARVHQWALANGRLACILDRPESSTFVNPAVLDVPGMTVAFASGGASPGTLRRLREDFEEVFSDPRFGRWLQALGALRARLPRGERASRMAAAVRGFALEARLHFPEWFERGGEPPSE